MRCPVCYNPLTQKQLALPTSNNWDEMQVDVCEGGCGGFWFDRFELDKVDEPDEVGSESLLDVERNPDIEVDHDDDRYCPKCEDVVMMNRFFSVSRDVEVDECGGCGGIWIDAGELEEIRQLYDSEEEREQAFERHFEKELAPELEQLETERRDESGILRALRFVCPTYWIPGDQEWGAH